MKKKGSVCDYKVARNEELKHLFFNRLGNPAFSGVLDIFEDLALQPASRFFISETRAFELIRHKQRYGSWPADILKNRLQMIEELERRVTEAMANDPNLHLFDAVFDAVNSPAPRFYLTPGSVRSILYAHIKRRRA